MKHERAFADDRTDEEHEVDARIAAMPPPPGQPATDEEIAGSIARARADVAAGRVYPHAVVAEWLQTWGKPDRLPFKEWLALRDG